MSLSPASLQSCFFSTSILLSPSFLRDHYGKSISTPFFLKKGGFRSSFSFSELISDRNFSNLIKSYLLLRFFCLFLSFPKWGRSSSRRKRVLCYKRTSSSSSVAPNFFYFWFLLQLHMFKRSESSLCFQPKGGSLSYCLRDLGHIGWPSIAAFFPSWNKSLSISFGSLDQVFLSYFKLFPSPKTRLLIAYNFFVHCSAKKISP